MKTVLTIVSAFLAIAAPILIGVPCLFLWAVGKAGGEEDRQIQQQMADEPFSCCYEDHDVSGLIEED